MFEAVVQILRDDDSLDLVMGSYQLLVDLNQILDLLVLFRFPPVYLAKTEKSESSSSSNVISQLFVVQEAWSPFTFGLDSYNEKAVVYISFLSLTLFVVQHTASREYNLFVLMFHIISFY
ncbi:Uncharacterized protein Adt_36014 [Abeliophyllum distichum]|uniref:Uncharacterized protein n=1 Tax=Abeliophyllum distichum TaxID=126358 RepID=A0ABD1QGC2_9LAMI